MKIAMILTTLYVVGMFINAPLTLTLLVLNTMCMSIDMC
jgi:hypothetical protein